MNHVRLFLVLACLSMATLSARALEKTRAPAASGELLVYVGTYTGAKSKGIYVSRLDLRSGKLSPVELAAETPNPTFLAIHPNRRWLYAVNEVGEFEGKPAGSVSAFEIDPSTGALKFLNQRSSVGSGPCHLTVDASGHHVLLANYGGGSVAVLPIQADGRLREATAFVQHSESGSNPQRQTRPHAHSINLDNENRFALVADLGLNKVLIYRFDAARGLLDPHQPPAVTLAPGAGPRHLAIHPKGRFAYVINERNCTMTAFQYDPKRGRLTEIQTLSTLPEGQSVQPGFSTAEVVVHPSGKFLYGSNRGHDSIVTYRLNSRTGKLTYVENQPTQGKTPRNFAIDPSGSFLLAENQGSDSIVVFRIDQKTGRLSPTGHQVEVGSPVCVRFVGID